jgi:hypothetical protein
MAPVASCSRIRLSRLRHTATLAILVLAFSAPSAHARGLATQDLTPLGAVAAKALGTGFNHRAEPGRLTLDCADCAGEPIVDILLGRQADGTEDRVRSGATTIADLERICQSCSSTCRVSAMNVSPAVGWVSAYPIGQGAGATAVVIRGGDLLTIRSVARDPVTARRSIDRLLPMVRAQIVGP